MRPFQLLSAIAVFNSLKIVAGESYWDCKGIPILFRTVHAAVELAFTSQPGSISGYPSICRTTPLRTGPDERRQFPLTDTGARWQGGGITYYVEATRDKRHCEVFGTAGGVYKCTLVLRD
ncbi:BgtE-5845 [Blumeria graminis f. sp. tritici]|uniref:BgtE-5845 n=2 Tax=Blumeria graminis f. sp. tritici TaxID=62690 RepID=A0A1L5JEG4_BLUGR|nr:BgtE-5845_p [Blumeria graminis f. sp. tritici]VDB88755.1 BgtE-5845 [Blumeria graminis f. sp. tritici]